MIALTRESLLNTTISSSNFNLFREQFILDIYWVFNDFQGNLTI